jgi:Integrase core domain
MHRRAWPLDARLGRKHARRLPIPSGTDWASVAVPPCCDSTAFLNSCDTHWIRRNSGLSWRLPLSNSVYGEIFTRRLRAMGIRDRPTAPRSPWQNGHTERLIGSIRRECLDHVVVFGEQHLRHLLLVLYGVLQWRENTPFPEHGCAGTTGCSGHRAHTSDSNSRRIHHQYVRI